MNPARLAVRVLRFDSRTRVSAILTALGVAVATVLVLLLSALPDAAEARTERSAWQFGKADPSVTNAASAMLTTQDFVRNKQITRIDVSGTPDDRGGPKFPAAGEMLLSPALADMAGKMPREQLADRFPGKAVGTIGVEHLRSPEQLVAVVGHPKGALASAAAEATVSSAEAAASSQDTILYFLSWFGLVVLAAPSLVLVASASRLTSTRRERRSGALQLAGASPSQVVRMVAAEVGIASITGTALGLVLVWPLRSLIAAVPWNGETWLISDFTPSPQVVVVAAIGIPALVVTASLLALRRVVTSPLSAVTEQPRSRPRAWRLLGLVAVAGFFLFGLSTARSDGGITILLGGLAAIVWCFSLVGPWITSTIGRVFVKVWRRPPMLLAGRRLVSNPQASYRSASGVVLAVFIGSLALTLLPVLESGEVGGRSFKDEVIYTDLSSARTPALRERLAAELDRVGVHADAAQAEQVRVRGPNESSHPGLVIDCEQASVVTRLGVGTCTGVPGLRASPSANLPLSGLAIVPQTSGSTEDPPATPVPGGTPIHPLGEQEGYVDSSVLIDPAAIPSLGPAGESTLAVLPPSDADREKVRTALVRAVPGSDIESRETQLYRQQTYVGDLRRVTAIGLAIAGLLAGCGSAITAAGSVIDRRRTLGALLAAGTPIRVLARALRTEAALPALVATLGAATAGIAAGAGLSTLAGENGIPVNPWILAPVALGLLVAVLAASASGPMLRRVAAEPLADE